MLANSAHEVRTPLNAIINYLEIALEGSLDQETRENLAKSHSASKSLIYVINDLLDLTKTEEGKNLVKDEIFNLAACIQEATDPFHADSQRKGLEYSVIQHPGIPQFVHGDARMIRQAISNVVANAIAYTEKGQVKLDVYLAEVQGQRALVEFAVEDSGAGMDSQQLDALFQDLEQVSTEADLPEDGVANQEKPPDTRKLGLGLAVVARIVRNMDGQLRLKSVVGQGSRFIMQLPFQLSPASPLVGEGKSATKSHHTSGSNAVEAQSSFNLHSDGEIMLVDSHSTGHASPEIEKIVADGGSMHSRRSRASLGSQGSVKSDAERLINAIRTPLSLDKGEGDYFTTRGGSKTSLTRPTTSEGNKAGQDFIEAVHVGPRPHSPTRAVQRVKSPGPVARSKGPEPGTSEVRGSKMPVRAVKVPDDFQALPEQPQPSKQSRVLFELPATVPKGKRSVAESTTTATSDAAPSSLHVLIAEDDPINVKILRKRLEKLGHQVTNTANGEICAAVFKEKSTQFDVVLMDMQVRLNLHT